MEFLVEFDTQVPDGTPGAEVERRRQAEASAAAALAHEGHLVRVWRVRNGQTGASTVLGLYRADTDAQLDALLRDLPLYDWMRITVTRLEPHPNDPAQA